MSMGHYFLVTKEPTIQFLQVIRPRAIRSISLAAQAGIKHLTPELKYVEASSNFSSLFFTVVNSELTFKTRLFGLETACFELKGSFLKLCFFIMSLSILRYYIFLREGV